MIDAAVIQGDLQCPACGGQCVYDPAQSALACESCGAVRDVTVDPNHDPAHELHYHPDLPHTEQPEIGSDLLHSCETCGGAVIFAGPSLSDRCAYCNGPVVRAGQDERFDTMGMIPFRIAETDAQQRALEWVRKRLAAPGDLAGIVSQGRVAGIYVPFFTFDSQEYIEYSAYYKTGSGKNARTRRTSGKMTVTFDDLLAPASPHITSLIRDGILHDFDPERLRPYTPAFLSGFAAEQHHLSVAEGLDANAPDKDLLIRNRIKRHINKSRITDLTYKTDTRGMRYRRILLPVWILHYTYRDKPMKVVVCGMQGRTFGERPFSSWKLAGFSGVISALALAFGWAWGAMGVF